MRQQAKGGWWQPAAAALDADQAARPVSDRVKREAPSPPPRRVAQVPEEVCAYGPLLRPEDGTQWEYC